MDIRIVLSKLFSIGAIDIIERIKTVSSKFIVNKIQLPAYSDLVDFFASIPMRDNWSFNLLASDEVSICISRNENNEAVYREYLDKYSNDDEVAVQIDVQKSVSEGKISVYNLQSFIGDLASRNILNIMEIFSDLLKGQENLTFVTFDSDKFFSTRTIAFTNNELFLRHGEFSRINRISECNQNSFFTNAERVALIPEDFLIDNNYEHNTLAPIFKKIQTILSLRSISSNVTIEDDRIRGLIRGQRNLDFSYALEEINYNRSICALYNWIYTDGNIADKISMSRNIVSLHCKWIDLLRTDDRTLSSIQANYELYLKENVNKYIEAKNKMGEFISTNASQYAMFLIDIINSFIRNLVALFASVMTVIFSNLLLARPLDNVFTKEVVGLFYIVLCGSLVYMMLTLIIANAKIKGNRITYEQLKKNYLSFLSSDDINEVFGDDNLINTAEKSQVQNCV